MRLSQIAGSQFTLRDYISYFFPGVVLLAAIAIVRPAIWVDVKNDTLAISLILFVGGYVLGFFSHVVSTLILMPFNRVLGDPHADGILGSSKPLVRSALDENFKSILRKELELAWGKEIASGKESNLLFLCWRDIQRHDHRGLEYLFRSVSMYNMALNLIFAFFALSLALIHTHHFCYAALSLLLAASMYRGRFVYRREFVRNVYRIWYVYRLHHEEQREPSQGN